MGVGRGADIFTSLRVILKAVVNKDVLKFDIREHGTFTTSGKLKRNQQE